MSGCDNYLKSASDASLKTKYLTEKCKLLTGSFPTFPCEKSFCKLTMKEIPVLLYFKKLVQRK
jgi:hypothetical protein